QLAQSRRRQATADDTTHTATPYPHCVRSGQAELIDLMGPGDTSLEYAKRGPTAIMMVGLQGSGKTTTVGKLARFLTKLKKRPLLVAADIYRPAAIEQLRVLGEQLDLPVFTVAGAKPPEICDAAMKEAHVTHRDAVIFDTAGR